MMETWKEIVGYEGIYEVSDLGRVRCLGNEKSRKEKILKPGKNNWGYLQINLCKDGKDKRMLVHRLVAEAFVPNPNDLETVNHKDEDKTNNSASNLEWLSMKDNVTYSQARRVQMFDKQGNLLATFPSTQEAGRVTGIAQQSICSCCHGKLKTACGFKWRYMEG